MRCFPFSYSRTIAKHREQKQSMNMDYGPHRQRQQRERVFAEKSAASREIFSHTQSAIDLS
jgi:hypothetical protein